MAVIGLLLKLLSGQMHLVCIHHNDEVTGVYMGGKDRLGLPLSTDATTVASLPRVLPFASTMNHFLTMSSFLAEYVAMTPAFSQYGIFYKNSEYKQFHKICQAFCRYLLNKTDLAPKLFWQSIIAKTLNINTL